MNAPNCGKRGHLRLGHIGTRGRIEILFALRESFDEGRAGGLAGRRRSKEDLLQDVAVGSLCGRGIRRLKQTGICFGLKITEGLHRFLLYTHFLERRRKRLPLG